ncbi:F-box/LRR-repeat protein 19-like [Palaemon carinicauda]|uniref:F-box/LRR-repeat protein 19-like n=1 Tax=Palaemon carinicauda TaxID=392227 RepID=UPI0035B5C4C8
MYSQNNNNVSPLEIYSWEMLQARLNKAMLSLQYGNKPSEPRNRKRDKQPADPRLQLCTNETVMLSVFRYLTKNERLVAMRVCKAWERMAVHPSLWKSVNASHQRIESAQLTGVVRRLPETLDLNWSKIEKEHLSWLLTRLPQLRELHLQGQALEVVGQLYTIHCPPLRLLDISFTADLTDANINKLFSPPNCIRTFQSVLTTKMVDLKELHLAGTLIGDDGVLSIAKILPSLTYLDVKCCLNVTDLSVVFLSHPQTPISSNLVNLDMRGCHQLTYASFDYFPSLPSLRKLALYPCWNLPLKLLQHWGRRYGFVVNSDKILEKFK